MKQTYFSTAITFTAGLVLLSTALVSTQAQADMTHGIMHFDGKVATQRIGSQWSMNRGSAAAAPASAAKGDSEKKSAASTSVTKDEKQNKAKPMDKASARPELSADCEVGFESPVRCRAAGRQMAADWWNQ
jgi:hypothetical protein